MFRTALLLILAVTAIPVFGVAIGHRVAGAQTVEHATPRAATDCERPAGVVDVGFSASKYPHIREHMEHALREGWPRILVLWRDGATGRRDRLLRDHRDQDPATDIDEYPPAVGRTAWLADTMPVPSSENRSHGSTMGTKLRRYCDGTLFRMVFY